MEGNTIGKYPSKYFGEIDFQKLEEWYETTVKTKKSIIEISITTSMKSNTITEEEIREIDNFIDNLNNQEEKIRLILNEDYNNNGNTKYYIESIMKNQNSIDVLNLRSIVFYPEEEEMFAVLDYAIDEDLTDSLLVIQLFKNKIFKIVVES